MKHPSVSDSNCMQPPLRDRMRPPPPARDMDGLARQLAKALKKKGHDVKIGSDIRHDPIGAEISAPTPRTQERKTV
ncbi:hypothetical protein Ga0100231_023770 [Opitutaceae bacterium TAV4]|nr:hypothetical protein Ga0100231_023770 [Opitutaceae bacterium TAV4]RRK00894.1 hypothetical protein Ga0100230_024280 [Opitutaceae bacterium TAV3]